MGIGFIVQAVITVASVASQISKQKKLKRQQEASAKKAAEAQDAARGMRLTKRGEVSSLPICYGNAILGGVESRKFTSSRYVGSEETVVDKTFSSNLGSGNYTGTKNNILNINYALCLDGIEGVQWAKVDGLDYNDGKAKFKHRIRTYNTGGIVDQANAATAQVASPKQDSSRDAFTGLAHASATFVLNREEPQYNGFPTVEFLIKGRKVRHVINNNGVFSLSTTYFFSNNPALCLLDYLLNEKFGASLDESEIDLESFYRATNVCDTIVGIDRTFGGKVNDQKRVNSVSTFVTLPGDLEERTYDNDVWFTEDTGKYYIWNKTEWIESNFRAPERVVVSNSLPGFPSFNYLGSIYKVDGVYHRYEQEYQWIEKDVSNMNTAFSDAGDYYTVTEVSDYASLPTLSQVNYPNQLWKTLDENRYYAWDLAPVWQTTEYGANTRILRLYECNLTLDTENPIRDNIEAFMNTMGLAELSWNTKGQYKLSVEYPQDEETQEALVTSVFDENNILPEPIDVNWGDADSRLNQATVRFINEHEDFKEDSVVWPPASATPSSPYQVYLTEDNNRHYRASLEGVGITDPYHALAFAESAVRQSREMYTISFSVDRSGLVVEPSDFIKVSIPNMGITNEIFRVESAKIRADFSVLIKAYKFDKGMLAWTVDDDIAYLEKATEEFEVEAPTTPTFTLGSSSANRYSIGTIAWEYNPEDTTVTFDIFYKPYNSSNYIFLANTRNKYFEFEDLTVPDRSLVDFAIYTKTPLGTRSEAVELKDVAILMSPNPIISLDITEEQYLTNNASGLKTRAVLSWEPDHTGVTSSYFLIEYKSDADPQYETVGTTSSTEITINDIKEGIYSFRITPFSFLNYSGDTFNVNKTIVGYSQPPADPANFSGNINEGQINLRFDLSTDLDVLYGGYSQIRLHPLVDGSASWETSSIIVESLAGNTNNKTVPTLRGTFFIKFFDAFGNESLNAASFVSLFVDKTFNVVDVLDEAALEYPGVKTNCTVNISTGNLELDAGQTSMTYEFSSYIDLGEIATTRLVPEFTAKVFFTNVTVASYLNISTLERFIGPFVDATAGVYVATTDDDPAATPTWSDWKLLTISSFTARALKFKLEVEVPDTNTAFILTSAKITVDKKDIIEVGSSTSSATGDTTVTFTSEFYGGPSGVKVPFIGVAVINGVTGDDVVITSKSKSEFSYSVYNSGSRVVRDLDYQAIGQ